MSRVHAVMYLSTSNSSLPDFSANRSTSTEDCSAITPRYSSTILLWKTGSNTFLWLFHRPTEKLIYLRYVNDDALEVA